ncbi:MAG: tetratricopeptide repeat protein [Aliifodinibius sp.]|nr:tetratricopeptide repeat protein [candidate division Zixibacteria bacterium]NIT57226.1 tetratricopeptide repeat protein [Fodinibius sp.]NIW40182.1 tetratricopeptide repeat protein [candidate division Zixibacteria bacterium]NIX56301.1 tetratricopeptide repeat protein [candidate division Zixibacteria bacterium]NIY25808.1 tetratricopeptide repeat protein [Fodinibius sp.]
MADKKNMNSHNKNKATAGGSGMKILVTGIAIIVLVLLVRFVFLGGSGSANTANSAIDLLKQERFSEAEDKFQQAFAADPELMFTSELKVPHLFYVGLANAYLENGDLNTASRYYEEGYRIDTSGFDRYAKFVRGDYHYPEDAYLELGNQFWNARNLDLARKAYERALDVNPNFSSALTNLGNVLRLRGNMDEAVQMYQRALTVDPSLFEARVNLLSLTLATGRDSEFDIHLERLKEYYPESEYTSYFLAEQKKSQGNCKEALELFQSFIEKNPNHLNSKLSHIDCHLAVGNFDQAQQILKELALRMGDNPSLKERALDPAEKAFQAGDYEKARHYYESMSAIWPDDPRFRFGLATSMINLEQLAEARVILEDMVHNHPESSEILSNLGLVYAKMGKPEWAREQFEAAISIDSSAVAYYNLGKIFEEQGDTAKANSCYILASLKEPEMFGLQDYMMEVSMEKAERIARGDTAGMIFPDYARDSANR